METELRKEFEDAQTNSSLFRRMGSAIISAPIYAVKGVAGTVHQRIVNKGNIDAERRKRLGEEKMFHVVMIDFGRTMNMQAAVHVWHSKYVSKLRSDLMRKEGIAEQRRMEASTEMEAAESYAERKTYFAEEAWETMELMGKQA